MWKPNEHHNQKPIWRHGQHRNHYIAYAAGTLLVHLVGQCARRKHRAHAADLSGCCRLDGYTAVLEMTIDEAEELIEVLASGMLDYVRLHDNGHRVELRGQFTADQLIQIARAMEDIE